MRSVLVAGLGWGDESKGATTEALTRHLNADLIVRYGGGCQCAHNVITPEGVHHTFAQFGAGMLANNKVRTHLSRFMLVEPLSMVKEAEALGKLTDDVWDRTTVDRDVVIITPLHRALNRVREARRGTHAHGSCGRGIGVAREMQLKYGQSVLMAKDLEYRSRTIEKLEFLFDEVAAEIGWNDKGILAHLANLYNKWPATIVSQVPSSECMIFEGAQGVMLDEKHGTAPHNTWTNTTFENADTLLDEMGCTDRMRIGCLRSYYTRHGAGPFPTEDNTLDLPEPHNGNDEFQGKFRVGSFDWNLASKAIGIVGGVDGLAISHLDYLPRLGFEESPFLEHISEFAPVVMTGRGPTAGHRTINLEVAV